MRRFLTLLGFALLCLAPALAAGGGEEGKSKKPKEIERKLTASPNWVAVDPMTVAILRDSTIDGMMLVEIGLDVPDGALREKAEAVLPRLRDVWLRALADYASTRARIGRQADLNLLGARLQTATNRVLGAPGAQLLFLQAVVRER